jgi:predicted regulator of Ras-like GTPase activity (Roadblock/LC7/MglB family)
MATPKEILEAITKVEGVEAAMAVGRDGLLLSSAGKSGIDLEAIGAVASSTLGSAEVLGDELASGSLDQVIMQFENGITVLEAVGKDVILGVFARSGSNIGVIRLAIRRNKDALAKAFAF